MSATREQSRRRVDEIVLRSVINYSDESRKVWQHLYDAPTDEEVTANILGAREAILKDFKGHEKTIIGRVGEDAVRRGLLDAVAHTAARPTVLPDMKLSVAHQPRQAKLDLVAQFTDLTTDNTGVANVEVKTGLGLVDAYARGNPGKTSPGQIVFNHLMFGTDSDVVLLAVLGDASTRLFYIPFEKIDQIEQNIFGPVEEHPRGAREIRLQNPRKAPVHVSTAKGQLLDHMFDLSVQFNDAAPGAAPRKCDWVHKHEVSFEELTRLLAHRALSSSES